MTRRTLPRTLAVALAPLAMLAAACGGDDDDEGSADGTAASTADVVAVGVEGIQWDKDAYTATAGDVTIELVNESSLPHTLAVVAPDDTKVGRELDTPTRNDTDTDTYPLPAGTYQIICTVAGHAAMKATLTVS